MPEMPQCELPVTDGLARKIEQPRAKATAVRGFRRAYLVDFETRLRISCEGWFADTKIDRRRYTLVCPAKETPSEHHEKHDEPRPMHRRELKEAHDHDKLAEAGVIVPSSLDEREKDEQRGKD